MKTSLFSLTGALAVSGLISGTALAQESCVQQIDYWTTLHAPHIESWATSSILETPTPESECRLTSKLMGLFTYVQQKTAEITHGKPLRGTHAKGICINGTFQPQLSNSLKTNQIADLNSVELFQSQQTMPVQFRFANAAGTVDQDWKADVRALSMKITLPSGHRQDFAFNNVPRFELDSLANFNRVMQFAKGMADGQIHLSKPADPVKDGAGIVGYFAKLHESEGEFAPIAYGHAVYDAFQLKGVEDLGTADKKWHPSYTSQVYWSTAFGIGEGSIGSTSRIVKFGAAPCSKVKDTDMVDSEQLKSKTLPSEAEASKVADDLLASGKIQHKENYLSESLVDEVKTGPVCYELLVQFLSETSNQQSSEELVENTTIVWNGPVHSLGRLMVNNDVMDQEACDAPSNFVRSAPKPDADATLVKSAKGIYGLGQINRARDYVETVSWEHR